MVLLYAVFISRRTSSRFVHEVVPTCYERVHLANLPARTKMPTKLGSLVDVLLLLHAGYAKS